ncbi:unnamed protein product [Cuscuta campestris]|uniref:Uncharacterized protein n=1 Tax=Cuscuta campestris TaxID=132261 RepID=A0A484LYF4_9ASTE|nr:unnamed protein product [Cuscuta campestris]
MGIVGYLLLLHHWHEGPRRERRERGVLISRFLQKYQNAIQVWKEDINFGPKPKPINKKELAQHYLLLPL